MAIGLVIFDCDGVLVDSEGLAAEAMAAMATEHGVPMSSDEALVAFRGGRMQDCVDAISERRGSALAQTFTSDYRAQLAALMRARLQPMHGARELLASLRLPFCVASSAPREKIELGLGVTGLLDHVAPHIFSAYEVGHWKPDPRLFLHAARTMGVSPGDCVVVEDSEHGLRAGLAAGMHVVALRTEGVDARFDTRIEVVDSLSALPDLLARVRQPASA